MKEFIDICREDGAMGGWICLLTSIVLLIVSFFTPPMWIIDASVLAGVGELFGFATLFKLPNMIQSIRDGKSVKLSKGDTSIEVTSESK